MNPLIILSFFKDNWKVLAAISIIIATYFFAVSNTDRKWKIILLEEQAKVVAARDAAKLEIEKKQDQFDEEKIFIAKTYENYRLTHPKIEYKKVIKYVTKESDDKCIIPHGFIRLHNDAVQNLAASGTGEVDRPRESNDTATTIKLSTVGDVVAGNYNICHNEMKKLELLQATVKAFQEKQK